MEQIARSFTIGQKKSSAKQISNNEILLIDSGGHYSGGTTDVTRTFYIGDNPSDAQKLHYTLVLKGHLALARAKFPIGTTGAQLDALARQFLWQQQLDYAHGTGHGVGNCLSVHEGSVSISPVSQGVIKERMIFSNEPGYYIPGKYGIRIENLMHVRRASKNFLEFSSLTLLPYSKTLIDMNMLSDIEIAQIQRYYAKINKIIKPYLTERAKKWIEKLEL